MIGVALEGCNTCASGQCHALKPSLENPASEESILHQWDTVLPEVLQRWDAHPGQLSAFSDGYRNASLIKDRVSFLSAA